MNQNENRPEAGLGENVSGLIEMSQLDTLFRDLYLQRARHFLEQELTIDAYRNLKRSQTKQVNLQNQIRNAMGAGDWRKVSDLSSQYQTLSGLIDRDKPFEEFGMKIYESRDLPVDPFSPGMSSIPGVSSGSLKNLRDTARQHLQDLCRTDREWQDFYLRRSKAFAVVSTETGSVARSVHPPVSQLENDAARALETGNFGKLGKLAENLLRVSSAPSASSNGGDGPNLPAVAPPQDYLFDFKPETIERARSLGLGLYHVPSRHREFAPFRRFAWHPNFAPTRENHTSVLRVPDMQWPEGTPEAFKARLQLFANHPLINSSGVRFLPSMVSEDVLVEDFDEPEAGSAMAESRLLDALGMPKRNELNRLQIETLLLERGNDLLRNELGLDPVDFRLVCIPPDLYLRIGLDRGWGQQKIWTHFDGYMLMEDGKLWALAGGDIRYGGIYDLLGITRNYDSERVIVRLAVVQRCRMAIWQ